MDWQQEWAITLGSKDRSLSQALRLWWESLPEPWSAFLLKVARFFRRNLWAWLIVAVGETLAALAVFAWGYDSLPSDPITNRLDRTTYYYLLSAQAQALAAILALVFTLSLVAAQLAQRYTSRLFTQVFGPWALLYLVPFLAAVIYPLLLLNRDFSLLEARSSLLLGAYCILTLIPYFFDLRDGLTLKRLIQGQLEEALSRYRKQQTGEEPEAVAALDNLAMGAFAAHDYDTFELAVKALKETGITVAGDPRLEEDQKEKSLKPLLKRLGNMGLRTLADPTAPSAVLRSLEEVGSGPPSTTWKKPPGRPPAPWRRWGPGPPSTTWKKPPGRPPSPWGRWGSGPPSTTWKKPPGRPPTPWGRWGPGPPSKS